MKHEPCGLLSDPECAANLIAGDSILGVRDQPHDRKPFIQAERRILENGPDFNGELPLRMMIAALPAEMILEETNLGALRKSGTATPSAQRRKRIAQAVFRFAK